MARERAGQPPSYAEAMTMKSLTLHTHDCLGDYLKVWLFYNMGRG